MDHHRPNLWPFPRATHSQDLLLLRSDDFDTNTTRHGPICEIILDPLAGDHPWLAPGWVERWETLGQLLTSAPCISDKFHKFR